jgi:hypothetical protein
VAAAETSPLSGDWRRDSILGAIYDYWHAKRLGRRFPLRADIDPVEMGPRLLPHIVLTEAVDDGGKLRFRNRLAGSAIAEIAGREIAGGFVDAINPNRVYAAYVSGLFRMVAEKRCPVVSNSVALPGRTQSPWWTRRLMCPLSSDGAKVDLFLTGMVFYPLASVLTAPDIPHFQKGETQLIDAG